MNKVTNIMAIATLFSTISLVSCKNAVVPPDQLPESALSFIKEYFPEIAVSYVRKDAELTHTTYEVVLQDGTEIEFNAKGEWDNVDCNRSAVPAELVPEAIFNYVKDHFPGQAIVKIDKEPYGHEIELANDLELKFGKDGQLKNIDD